MSNKAVSYIMFIIVCIFLLSYLFTINLVLPSGEPVKGQLKAIISYAEQGKWVEAKRTAESLERTWDGVKYILALNYAESDYSLFIELINRVKGSVEAKDSADAVNEATAALELWENFLRLIPQP